MCGRDGLCIARSVDEVVSFHEASTKPAVIPISPKLRRRNAAVFIDRTVARPLLVHARPVILLASPSGADRPAGGGEGDQSRYVAVEGLSGEQKAVVI